MLGDQAISRTDYQFESQKHVPLNFTVLKNDRVKSVKRYQMMIVSNDSWNAVDECLKTDFRGAEISPQLEKIKQLLAQDAAAVVIFTPRGVGKNRWNTQSKIDTHNQRRFYLLGQTADGMRIFDIMRCIASLKSVSSDDIDVSIHAEKSSAILSVYAAIFEPTISKLHLSNPPASHRSGPYLLNVRKLVDVPQAIALAAETSSIELSTDEPDSFRFLKNLESATERKSSVQLNLNQ